jgi:predicted transcriptional regulator
LTIAPTHVYTDRVMPQPPHRARHFSPRKTGDASPLGQLESALMEVVWSRSEPVSVSEVHAALPAERPVAYTTVKTTLERLAGKGILLRAREGKAYLYQAAVSREELERRIVADALDRLVEQFPQAVASFFIRPDSPLSDRLLALLLEAVERHRDHQDA